MNSERHSDMLRYEPKPAISKKTPWFVVFWLCVCSMTTPDRIHQIEDLKVEVLSHPLYSSDLAPNDFHFF
jgi:hypothetical protein